MSPQFFDSEISLDLGERMISSASQITQALNNRPTLGGGFTVGPLPTGFSPSKRWTNGTINIDIEGPVIREATGEEYYVFGIWSSPAPQGFAEKVEEIKDLFVNASQPAAGSSRRRKSRKSKKSSRRRRTTRKH